MDELKSPERFQKRTPIQAYPKATDVAKPKTAYINAVVLDKDAVEKWVAGNAPRKSTDRIIVEYVPAKAGLLASRIGTAMKDHGTLYVNPNMEFALAPFLKMYGFQEANVPNAEGLVVYTR